MEKKQALQIFAILALGILVFALASAGLAFQNEPEGFRGLKWGDAPDEKCFIFLRDGVTDCYLRVDEHLDVLGVEVEQIEYLFYRDRFYAVMISFSENNGLKRWISFLHKFY